jgi:hypothetical protein
MNGERTAAERDPEARVAQTSAERCTQLSRRSQCCLFTRPPLPPLFPFFAPFFTSAHPASARSRVPVPSASKFGQNDLLCICWVQRSMIVRRWLTPSRLRLRHWCRWPQRHLLVQSQILLIDFNFTIRSC